MTPLRKIILFVIFLLPLIAGSSSLANTTFRTDKLTCEYLVNPLGINTVKPRFSWTIVGNVRNQHQSAFEFLVSDNEKELGQLKGNVWQTGKVASETNVLLKYDGIQLKPFTRYYWRVRIYDQNGNRSKWSTIQWFETAMFMDTDWQGKWIGDGSKQFERDEDFYKNDPSPVFRRAFTTRAKLESARLYISGIGYYEAYLNGAKVGDHLLDPGWTAYGKEVLYTVYDITSMLKAGKNAMGIMLGNGWYNPLPLRFWGKFNMREVLSNGRPCVKAMIRLSYSNGTVETISTDEAWHTAPGPIMRNNVYLGEHYDARLHREGWSEDSYHPTGWKNAVAVPGPAGKLTVQMQPPVRITGIIQPISVIEAKPGVFVFDMGHNFAGIARIRVKGPAGTKITMRYGEDKYADGQINLMTSVAGQIKKSNGGPGSPAVAWQEDSYVLSGKGTEVWNPRFTYHGFRFVEVTGWPGKPALNDIKGLRLSADLESNGSFSSDNAMFNELNGVIRNTFLSNVFSVQSDCPAREKLGYGGDLFCTTEAFMYNFDMAGFYRKVLRDFVNDQRPSGGITETMPFVGIADASPGEGSGPLGFQMAFSYLVKMIHDFYGDKEVIEEYYPALKKHIGFLRSKARENLFEKEDLGDHEALTPKSIPLAASVFYYLQVKMMADFASELQKESDRLAYSRLAAEIRQAINEKFDQQNIGKFETGTQTAQAISLWAGIAGKEKEVQALDSLEARFREKDWHVSTGIFGTKMLFDVLRKADRNETAYRVANQRDFPGWGFMLANGATTLWETWKASDNTYSKNHPMFGSVSEWFYRSILGINAAAPGFKKVVFKPQPAGDLKHAKGTYQSVYGPIVSDWSIKNDEFIYRVVLPANTRGEVWLPNKYGKEILEQGKKINTLPDIKILRIESGYTLLEIGSGSYSFLVK